MQYLMQFDQSKVVVLVGWMLLLSSVNGLAFLGKKTENNCSNINYFNINSFLQEEKLQEDILVTNPTSSPQSRRKALSTLSSLTTSSLVATAMNPKIANARYVLNEETGEYEEITEDAWQTTWKQRLDKASTMSSKEIFNAARGAGNVNLKNGMVGEEESGASKKRRAMSACRDVDIRSQAGVQDVKDCNRRVMGGDFDFILEKL